MSSADAAQRGGNGAQPLGKPASQGGRVPGFLVPANGAAANGVPVPARKRANGHSVANGAKAHGERANGHRAGALHPVSAVIGSWSAGAKVNGAARPGSEVAASAVVLSRHAAPRRGTAIAPPCGVAPLHAPVPAKLGHVEMARRVNWLQSIQQWQEEFLGAVTATEFMEVMQRDLLTQTVFAFTVGGDIMRLPKGATVVDFAYHVHSEVGNSMVAAKVNGRHVPVSHELRNADVVEVIQYARASAGGEASLRRHREWLPYARTQSARHKLQKFVREHSAAMHWSGDEASGACGRTT
jgi:sulfur carrier protein ThiS